MGVGGLVREWRTRRRLSQMDLALRVYVSTRHLSFVETGRARPSPELLLAVAAALDVPLRERNNMLLAAGYAPRFTAHALDDPAMLPVRRAVGRMLDAHDPYPGVAIDRAWNVVIANRAASALVAGLPPALAGPPLNVYRACLHPDGLARITVDFAPWADYLLRQLTRSIALTGDERLVAIEAEVRAYPNVAALAGRRPDLDDELPLLVPLTIAAPAGPISMFTTLTTFGTPRDITVDELAVELFFPADDDSDARLRAGAPPA
jgi:transcriptional regulator with XRE-family HTH domain